MTPKDRLTLVSETLLVAALFAFLAGLGVTTPAWAATATAILVAVSAVTMFVVNRYVAWVGPDNTSADEAKDAVEDAVNAAADEVRR